MVLSFSLLTRDTMQSFPYRIHVLLSLAVLPIAPWLNYAILLILYLMHSLSLYLLLPS